MVRTWILIAIAAGGCKTATEKECDAMLERYESCAGTPLTASMTSAAHAACYVSLGRELQAGDTTSFAAVQRAALQECSVITGCEPLKACFEKHQCRWVLVTPSAEPFFDCSK